MRSVQIVTVAFCQLFITSLMFASELAIPQQVLDLQKSAETAVQQKDYQTALNLYAKISSSFPAYAMDAQRDITTTHLISGNKQLANEELKKMWDHRANPRFVEAMQRIKDQYWWSGHGPESQTLCEQIMAACPDDPKTMNIHGDYIRGFIAMGTPEKAKPSFENLITRYRQNPQIVPILVAIKDQYWWGGFGEQSQNVCEHILATYPDDPQTMTIHGDYIRGCILTGNLEKAKPSLDSFMTRYGKNEKIVPILTAIKSDYWLSGHQQESQTLCESIMAAYPDDPQTMTVHADYIRGCIALGHDEDFSEEFEVYWNKYHDQPDFFAATQGIVSECLYGAHDLSRALEISLLLLKNYPSHEKAIETERDVITIYLEMGAKEMAAARLENLKVTYATNANLPAVLIHLGERYRFQQQFQDCINLHQSALALKPAPNEQVEAYAGIAKAAARRQEANVDPNAPAATGTDVDAIVQSLLTNYKDNQRLGFHVFQIGEEYYFKAEEIKQKGDLEHSRSDFVKALAVWQKNINEISDSHHQCLAYYYSAVAYQNIGDNENATLCYQQVVNNWPNYEKAWYAQYQIAKGYEYLMTQSKASLGDVRIAYQTLLDKYPDCSAASIAKTKLNTL